MKKEQMEQSTPLERQILDFKKELTNLFVGLHENRMSVEDIKKGYLRFFESEDLKALLPEDVRNSADEAISQALTMTDKEEFIARMFEIAKPLIEIKLKYPKLFEDVEAKVFTKSYGFELLNERISYGINKDEVHFHLAASFEVKDKLPELIWDGLRKLGAIVDSHKEVTYVSGTSWLVDTKKYGDLLIKFGFKINDITPEFKDQYFRFENRPVKRATMGREEFLKLATIDKDSFIKIFNHLA